MAAKQAGLSLEPLHGLSITAGWPVGHKDFVGRSASCSTFSTLRPPVRERVGTCFAPLDILDRLSALMKRSGVKHVPTRSRTGGRKVANMLHDAERRTKS